MPGRLIILGAGPKAVAVCAKAAALEALGLPAPEIVVIEKTAVAAHWSGQSGYTNGELALCTPPEKDIGFPYCSTCWGDRSGDVNLQMLRWSWQTYLVQRGNYSEWMDRGRPAPPHRDFTEYLNWVATAVQMHKRIVQANVIQIEATDDAWQLTCKRIKDGQHEQIIGDGLLITGTGDPTLLAGQPASHGRVFNGKSFWETQPFAKGSSVAVVGAGQTAATIAVALLQNLGPLSTITIINPYGVFYSRGESFTENRQFSDPTQWTNLSWEHRRDLIRRGDRGVFSLQSQQTLDPASNVQLLAGKVMRVDAQQNLVRLAVDYDGRREDRSYDYVVAATGFFPLAFLTLLQGSVAERIGAEIGADVSSRLHGDNFDPLARKAATKSIENCIEADLGLKEFAPRLHLPMLAAVAQGPGFPNLTCLGLLSDRVLLPYCQ